MMDILNQRFFRHRLLPVLLILTTAALTVQAQPGWKAGCARVCITPQEPVWMAGYAFRDHPSEGVRQDIWAKALALEDSLGRVGVIVTMDLLSIPGDFSDDLRNDLSQKLGLSREQIILNVSHTHSGPVIGRALRYIYPMEEKDWERVDGYTRFLKDRLLKLVGDALQDLEPVRLATGNGIARFATNRRNNNAATLTPMMERKGPHDYSVPVLQIKDTSGRMKTVLFAYACHNTVLSDYLIGGDYAGYAQEQLEKDHPGVTALFCQGAGADQNPLPRRKPSYAVQFGKELAAAVEQALEDGMMEQRPLLEMRYQEVELPLTSPLSLEELSKIGEGQDWQARWARGMVEEYGQNGRFIQSYPYPVECWRLGDQRLFALGGELVSGYALQIKSEYGNDAFVLGYSNDVMSYIPTHVIWDEGGYEGATAHRVYALPSGWTRDVQDRILNTIHGLAPLDE